MLIAPLSLKLLLLLTSSLSFVVLLLGPDPGLGSGAPPLPCNWVPGLGLGSRRGSGRTSRPEFVVEEPGAGFAGAGGAGGLPKAFAMTGGRPSGSLRWLVT